MTTEELAKYIFAWEAQCYMAATWENIGDAKRAGYLDLAGRIGPVVKLLVKKGRAAALEEAAKVCERLYRDRSRSTFGDDEVVSPADCAAGIRTLKVARDIAEALTIREAYLQSEHAHKLREWSSFQEGYMAAIEKAAQVCEGIDYDDDLDGSHWVAKDCAAAIRALIPGKSAPPQSPA
jgi:hypothetical protein